MEELNWFNCNGSESFVVAHKETKKMLFARYDSVYVFWDFYFPVDTEEDIDMSVVKGCTNMNDVVKDDYIIVGRLGNLDFEEYFKVISDELYPSFLKHLTK